MKKFIITTILMLSLIASTIFASNDLHEPAIDTSQPQWPRYELLIFLPLDFTNEVFPKYFAHDMVTGADIEFKVLTKFVVGGINLKISNNRAQANEGVSTYQSILYYPSLKIGLRIPILKYAAIEAFGAVGWGIETFKDKSVKLFHSFGWSAGGNINFALNDFLNMYIGAQVYGFLASYPTYSNMRKLNFDLMLGVGIIF